MFESLMRFCLCFKTPINKPTILCSQRDVFNYGNSECFIQILNGIKNILRNYFSCNDTTTENYSDSFDSDVMLSLS